MRARLEQAKTVKVAAANSPVRGGAAESLSLFGTGDALASTPFKSAVACATAFRVTTAIIDKTAMFASDNEARRMRDAAEYFRRKAIAAADIRRADAAIEQHLQEVAADPGPQLQIAARCVRRTEASAS